MPKVTVAITTYPGSNRQYLQEAIDSVNDQTFRDFELVVVDDPRTAREKWNELMGNCDTEYLWIFSHDDIALPNFLEVMIPALDAQPTAAAVFCYDHIIDQNGKRTGQTGMQMPLKPLYNYRDILDYTIKYGNIIRCPSFTLRTSMFRDNPGLRFPGCCGTAGDTAMWFRILAEHPIIILPDRLYKYRDHSESDTQKNVVDTERIFDSAKALEYGASLRPDDVPWTVWMGLGRAKAQRELWLEDRRLKTRLHESKHRRFIVVHEPPYENGTGVLAAERVKKLNLKENDWFTWYVYPTQEGRFAGIHSDVPILSCTPGDYMHLISRYNPTQIEFHHFLVWSIEFLGTHVPKTLWLHDATLWCPRFHLWDGEKVCSGPGLEKCAKCAGLNTSDIKARKDYLVSVLPQFKQIIANSEWTGDGLMKEYGVSCDVSEPEVPPLPLHPSRKRIGYFGNWYQAKGIYVLLDAMKQLPDFDLVMFSKGVPPECLDGRRMHGYGNVFVFDGYKRSDMPFLGGLVDVCVVPSLVESYGLVARELLSLGFKVVCTTAGGMKEIGTVEPGDKDALVKEIKEAL